MRVLLLAAGHGSRLRPITNTIPKCLVPIAGKPLLDYWLERLFAYPGIERVLINTHWLADAVVAHVQSSPFRDRIDLVQEDTLLGTGGTIVKNRAWLGQETVLVAHADNLTLFDLAQFITSHAARPPDTVMSMLAFRTDTPHSCGILELDDTGTVIKFHEKVENPPGNLANAAVYLLEKDVIDYAVSLDRPIIDLSTEIIPEFVGKIFSVETPSYHRDIGTPESLSQAEHDFSYGVPPLAPRRHLSDQLSMLTNQRSRGSTRLSSSWI